MNEIVRSIGMACEKRKVDPFAIGDIVDVHVRIVEGDKERVQIFTGTVIARKGIKNTADGMRGGVNASFTVRRMVQNTFGVERVFPLHSPRVEKIVVRKRARVRRAKLYYLRSRTGKRAKLKEQRLTTRRPKAKAQEPTAASQQAKADTGGGGQPAT